MLRISRMTCRCRQSGDLHPPLALQAVDFVRHRIHSGGFQADALRFVSVLGSAKAGIHRGKQSVDLILTRSVSEGLLLKNAADLIPH